MDQSLWETIVKIVILHTRPDSFEVNPRETSSHHKVFDHPALHEVGLGYRTAPMPQVSDSDPHHRYKSATGEIPPDQCDVMAPTTFSSTIKGTFRPWVVIPLIKDQKGQKVPLRLAALRPVLRLPKSSRSRTRRMADQ